MLDFYLVSQMNRNIAAGIGPVLISNPCLISAEIFKIILAFQFGDPEVSLLFRIVEAI